MADPIISGGIRAHTILNGVSGLAEDRYVTTWAFGMFPPGPVTETGLDDAAAALEDFWTSSVGVGDTIKSWLGSQVGSIDIVLYDLGQTPPREPHPYGPISFTPTSAASFPSEVSIALSFYADRNLPRQRGRVHIGPLKVTVADQPDGIVRPKELLRTDLAEAASNLASITSSVRWGVLSQADGVILQVTDGWIDDSFDTIRSRGEDSTTRTLWP